MIQRFPALRHRDLAFLLAGQLVSLTGTQMQQVAVVWQLYLFTRSPWALGLLGLFRVAPLIVFALGGGVVADAFDRRRLMIATQSTFALVSAGLATVSATGHAGAWALYGAAALTGMAGAFDAPARQALLPLLVPREDLPAALGLSAFVWQVATVTGPALGGVVLAWAGVVAHLRHRRSLVPGRHRRTPRHAPPRARSERDGGRPLGGGGGPALPARRAAHPQHHAARLRGDLLRRLDAAHAHLRRPAPRGGAARAGGAVCRAARRRRLAGLVLSSRGLPRRQGRAMLVSVAAYGAAVAVFGVSRSFALSILALAASGAADTVSMVIRQTLRQLLTPDALRGRMTSINMIFFAGGPHLGEVEAGAVRARSVPARRSPRAGSSASPRWRWLTLLAPSLREYERP